MVFPLNLIPLLLPSCLVKIHILSQRLKPFSLLKKNVSSATINLIISIFLSLLLLLLGPVPIVVTNVFQLSASNNETNDASLLGVFRPLLMTLFGTQIVTPHTMSQGILVSYNKTLLSRNKNVKMRYQ